MEFRKFFAFYCRQPSLSGDKNDPSRLPQRVAADDVGRSWRGPGSGRPTVAALRAEGHVRGCGASRRLRLLQQGERLPVVALHGAADSPRYPSGERREEHQQRGAILRPRRRKKGQTRKKW